MPGKIVVVGSSNTDMVIKTNNFPLPGETILGGKFLMNPGGKGANQAVAAARLGGEVAFIAKLGNDIFGSQAIQQFQQEGINTQFIFRDAENPSGVALITVDAKGENTIVVAQGANGALSEEEIQKAEVAIKEATLVLMQLEIPLATVAAVTRIAKQHSVKVILNPAPAMQLSDEIINGLYMITPNKLEAEFLTGLKIMDEASAEAAARILKDKGVSNVVITLGEKGAWIFTDTLSQHVPALKVEAVDTTAAGDVFNGALVAAISEGKELIEAVRFAGQAAAISVTKMGAQASAPGRNELTPLPVV